MGCKDQALRVGIGILTAVGIIGAAAPAVLAQSQFYGRVESFDWTEQQENGQRILNESGPLVTLGVERRDVLSSSSYSQWNAELFGGKVDYTGSTWQGTPITTDTGYLGFKAEGTYHQQFQPDGGFGGLVGLGYRGWKRDLGSSSSAAGYVEQWQTWYAKLGMEQQNGKVITQFGVKIPLYNENRVNAFGVTLLPGKEPSLFGEVKMQNRNSVMSLTYEGMRFSRSAAEYSSVEAADLVQPKSQADLWGLRYARKF